MKHTYSQQAQSIKTIINLAEIDERNLSVFKESLEAAREGQTSLNALALIGEATILRAQALEKIAREIVMEVLTDGRELNFAEVRQYAEDFNKVLNPLTKEVV